MAKVARERLVKERRALKLEKKQAAREAKAAGELTPSAIAEDGAEAEVAEAEVAEAEVAEADVAEAEPSTRTP